MTEKTIANKDIEKTIRKNANSDRLANPKKETKNWTSDEGLRSVIDNNIDVFKRLKDR